MADSLKPYAKLFAQPKGPGDERPTALQIIRDENLTGNLSGIVVLITGGTAGLGLETARALHSTGADVYITARDLKKADGVVNEILKSSEATGRLEVIEMDLNSLDSVKKAAQTFLGKSEKLNILINNAGVMAIPEPRRTSDGFEQQFGVNHIAHFAFTSLLLPTLIRSSSAPFSSRVVSISSGGHRYSQINFEDVNFTDNYDPFVAYGQSKTANIWMTNYIDRVYGPLGVHAFSVHPGGIMTALHANNPPELMEEWGKDAKLMAFMKSPEQGAATSIWAAVAKILEGKGGKYLYDCQLGEPAINMGSLLDSGYAPWAYNVEGEDKLWELSARLTGITVSK